MKVVVFTSEGLRFNHESVNSMSLLKGLVTVFCGTEEEDKRYCYAVSNIDYLHIGEETNLDVYSDKR